MNTLQHIIKKNVIDSKLQKYLRICNFGLEKENLRVDKLGMLALTDHPKEFGDKKTNPYITTDFAESQIEMVTPPCDTIDSVYEFMGALNDIVSTQLKGEYLWPQSNPPILPDESKIKVSNFKGQDDEIYREYLANKYGKKKQLISGVHFNFSYKDDFLKLLYKKNFEKEYSFMEFKNKIYLNIARNFLRYRWLLVYLTAASPVFHKTYASDCLENTQKISDDSFCLNNTYSLRNSDCGYKNTKDFFVSYNSINEYANDITTAIKEGFISREKEYYSPIRLKSIGGSSKSEDLLKYGIQYLEIRILDLDPTTEFGVSKDTLKLMHAFLTHMMFKENKHMNFDDCKEANYNDMIVTSYGRKKYIKVFECNEEVCLVKKGISIIDDVENSLRELGVLDSSYEEVLEKAKYKIRHSDATIASHIIKSIKESSFIDFHINRAKESLALSKNRSFSLRGFEDLELSTQLLMKESIKEGFKIDILDRHENFISISNQEKTEYVKQATKTSKDTYITALVMENKEVTKKVLKNNGVRVPDGEVYSNIEDAKADFILYKNKEIVIKPKTTNFGLGISIFKNTFTKEDFYKALEIAFKEDSSILIEEYIHGKEYRFLVIDNEVVGILHRVPANVLGDGLHKISELVEEKNKDFLRGKGYVKPLEKIKLGESEALFLKNQGLDFDYIPKNDEVVYLRENSNISTGGDSIDFTDEMHKSYKEIALKAANSVSAKITGIDIMILDINKEASEYNHSIIELNFNPAIHIHCYPYKGKNRDVAQKLLKLLFKK
ncbi:MAG: bifunctional glutamate--cysteine ligase GshA/glutathione synthetase GshB [Sarcina sp.]